MIDIRLLTGIGLEALHQLNTGYSTSEIYRLRKAENSELITITMELERLPEPLHKHWESTQDDLERYQQVVQSGYSLGAYLDRQQVGIAIAEERRWNRSLWIWEFYVAETHRRMGVGRQLMNHLADLARKAGLRIMSAETQNTNVPAIRFYRALGFEVDALDLSYYTNHDADSGEVAVFMKRKLE